MSLEGSSVLTRDNDHNDDDSDSGHNDYSDDNTNGDDGYESKVQRNQTVCD